MNPNNKETPIHLPEPMVETESVQTAEKQPSSIESASNVAQPAATPAQALPVVPLQDIPAVPLTPKAGSTQSANPAVASDDTDLIEKEWVNRAKAIVEKTRDDPHQQSDEISLFKADYMKKRYNRNVKLSR